MFASNGEITAPCGVPTSPGVTSPSSATPAFSHLRISRSTRRSATRCSTNRISHSWLTVSKHALGLDPGEPGDVGVQDPVHLAPVDPNRQRVQRIMLASPRPEPVAEPQEVCLPDRVQHFHQCALDDLVLQRRDAQWPLPSIRLRYIRACRSASLRSSPSPYSPHVTPSTPAAASLRSQP